MLFISSDRQDSLGGSLFLDLGWWRLGGRDYVVGKVESLYFN